MGVGPGAHTIVIFYLVWYCNGGRWPRAHRPGEYATEPHVVSACVHVVSACVYQNMFRDTDARSAIFSHRVCLSLVSLPLLASCVR